MISMARTFGAPLTVPAGSVARNTSMGDRPATRRPLTCDVRCITWLYFSSDMSSSTTTVPNSEYVALPNGFLELRNVQDNTNTPPTLLIYASPSKIDQNSSRV